MRALDPALAAALSSGVIYPAILVSLTFTTGTSYVWSGVGALVWNGNTYAGVGTLGKIGTITESNQTRADGTTVTLSGIDPTLYADSMNEIQLGAPALIYYALLSNGAIIGSPYLLFSGLVDKPTVSEGGDSIDITLQLENRMTNLQRASNKRYDSATQRALYPQDTCMQYVEQCNDASILWGSAN